MSKRVLIRGAGALAAAAICVVLVGCSISLPFVGSSAAARPSVGQCWNLTYNEGATWPEWMGGSPVNCSGSHQTVTEAVVTLPKSLPKSWRDSTTRELVTSVQIAATKACRSHSATHLPAKDGASRTVHPHFVSSLAEWKKGDRWVRCDVGVEAIGSTLGRPKLQNLPASLSALKTAITTHVDEYKYCVSTTNTTGRGGPFASADSVVADCTEQPQWHVVATDTAASGAPYPSPAEIHARDVKYCFTDADPGARAKYATFPSPTLWAEGDRNFDCWVIDGPET